MNGIPITPTSFEADNNNKRNAANKKLHIQLNHCGIMCLLPGEDAMIKQILDCVWKQFGTVTNVFYHTQYSYCFLSFATHDQAESAMIGLNDQHRLQAAIGILVSAFNTLDPQVKEFSLMRVNSLFVKGHNRESVLTASWGDNAHTAAQGEKL